MKHLQYAWDIETEHVLHEDVMFYDIELQSLKPLSITFLFWNQQGLEPT